MLLSLAEALWYVKCLLWLKCFRTVWSDLKGHQREAWWLNSNTFDHCLDVDYYTQSFAATFPRFYEKFLRCPTLISNVVLKQKQKQKQRSDHGRKHLEEEMGGHQLPRQFSEQQASLPRSISTQIRIENKLSLVLKAYDEAVGKMQRKAVGRVSQSRSRGQQETRVWQRCV